MDKKHFVLKLLPSRPNFASDMNAEERKIMQHHVIYWTQLMQEGKVIVFGPVMDPAGTYGLGIVEAENEEEILAFTANDPASKINRYEIFPMVAILPRK